MEALLLQKAAPGRGGESVPRARPARRWHSATRASAATGEILVSRFLRICGWFAHARSGRRLDSLNPAANLLSLHVSLQPIASASRLLTLLVCALKCSFSGC